MDYGLWIMDYFNHKALKVLHKVHKENSFVLFVVKANSDTN